MLRLLLKKKNNSQSTFSHCHNKSTNHTNRRIQNTVIYLGRKFSAVNHFEKELHLDEYASETA